jgi:3-deoxy-D-manno-octulosonate 8-phosphate phosphatase (KDO 8-P phosphatase)
MGDDDIDAPAIALAGVGVAPAGAMPAALAAADFVPARPAGLGAVREICELLLASRAASAAPVKRNKGKGERTNSR